MIYLRALLILFLFSLAACGPAGIFVGNPSPGADGHSAVFGTLIAADLGQCSTGGQALPYGVDSNDDGQLQTEETKGLLLSCNGQTGDAGAVGESGTLATPVKLCPGTQSYPTTFVEYAFCINGSLWGVYSANSGFLTYFPPGAYQSNAIGSSCNLTIGENCQVTH